MTAISAASATESDSRETANPFPDVPAIRGSDANPGPGCPYGPTPRRFPSPHFDDCSRTRFESRAAFGGPDENAEEIAAPTRQFSPLDITSGLPDDSPEAEERAATRQLREIRARVKVARAVVSMTPGLAETLAIDWQKAARFYARCGITEGPFRHGVVVSDPEAETSWSASE
jgi:hypothetical protein